MPGEEALERAHDDERAAANLVSDAGEPGNPRSVRMAIRLILYLSTEKIAL